MSGSNIKTFTDSSTNDIFMFTRSLPTTKKYMVLINIGHAQRMTHMGNLANIVKASSTSGTIEMKTGNVGLYHIGQMIALSTGVTISDGEGLVISFY